MQAGDEIHSFYVLLLDILLPSGIAQLKLLSIEHLSLYVTMVRLIPTWTLLWSFAATTVSAFGSASDMGPVAFLWPPDRVWGEAADNTAPCGSVSGVENRTQFPISELGIL